MFNACVESKTTKTTCEASKNKGHKSGKVYKYKCNGYRVKGGGMYYILIMFIILS